MAAGWIEAQGRRVTGPDSDRGLNFQEFALLPWKRVAVARALANDPRVILMDEPFGSLDAQTWSLMQEHFLDLHRITEMTVILVTHSVEEAVLLGHRIVVLSASPGRILSVLPGPRTTGREAKRDLKEKILEVLSGDEEAVGSRESSSRAAG